MAKRDLCRMADFTRDDVRAVFDLARRLKDEVKRGVYRPLLGGRTLAMLFEKPSLRTRSTFDIGMFQLGGHAVYLPPGEVGLGARESVKDVARNLGRWFDLVMARTYKQATVDELARRCWKPVINALSDEEHPCQALADFFTLSECFADLSRIRFAYVGDGNNVANSLIVLGGLLGVEVRVGCPAGYEPAKSVLECARRVHPRGNDGVRVVVDPRECVEGADAIYTDVWASMGQESEAAERARIFSPYQVNAELIRRAKPEARLMHCLPAHRGQEITDEAIDGDNSVVYDQAENRLHVQKAVLAFLFQAGQAESS